MQGIITVSIVNIVIIVIDVVLVIVIAVVIGVLLTRQDGRMSRTSFSHFERLGDLDLAASNFCSSSSNDLKTDTCHFLASRSA